jgi:hypothetical protein
MSTCPGTTSKGTPCARPVGPSGLCDRHDPAIAAERGRKGGQVKAAKLWSEREQRARELSIETIDEIREVLREAVAMAHQLMDPNAMIRGCTVALELIKARDLEKELNDLRDAVQRIREQTGNDRPVH